MRIAVTGSIATDHLMTFPGRFGDQLIADQLDRVSLSFLVDDLQIRRGGVRGQHLLRHGLPGTARRSWSARSARTSPTTGPGWSGTVSTATRYTSRSCHHTARFLCTTDDDHNQIASFYPGAMAEARHIELGPIAERLGGLDLVLISPNDPDAMVRHTDECRQRGIPFAADPSQQLARMAGEEIRQLVDGAAYLFSNDYEKGADRAEDRLVATRRSSPGSASASPRSAPRAS